MSMESEFKSWYYENGADWNAANIMPVWDAAWKAAKKEQASYGNSELLPCPCGETPTKLHIHDTGQGHKWMNAYGDCCGVWEVEFRANYKEPASDDCMALAVDAWNEAPRAR